MANEDVAPDKIGLGEVVKEREITKVVTGKVTRKKPNPAKEVATKFFGGDPKDVGMQIIMDVALPALKDLFVSIFEEGVERLVYGETKADRRHNRFSRRANGVNVVSYDRISQQSSARTLSKQSRIEHNFDDIVFETRAEATEVLQRMWDLIDNTGVCRVSDLYDLSGLTADYTDRSWGWTDLARSRVTQIREGFLLDLPKPVVVRS